MAAKLTPQFELPLRRQEKSLSGWEKPSPRNLSFVRAAFSCVIFVMESFKRKSPKEHMCLVNAICAKFATFFHSNDRDVTPNRLYICCSLSYLGAMLASSHALQHVSFPTQVLGKSVKPIPVMFMGVLLAGKRYSIAKYLCILLIVFGVALFMYKDQYSSHIDDSHPHFGIGEILLLVSLTLDGFTGATQDRMRSNYKTGANNMMLYVNVFSVIVVTFGLIVTDEVFEFVAFVSRHPVIIFSFIIFSLASALGQMFIFITVASFGPLTCSIVTTTRKFFTLLASIIIFQNSISRIQWVATSLVFMGIGLDTIYGRETTKII